MTAHVVVMRKRQLPGKYTTCPGCGVTQELDKPIALKMPYCGGCGKSIDDAGHDFCGWCGTKIDWHGEFGEGDTDGMGTGD